MDYSRPPGASRKRPAPDDELLTSPHAHLPQPSKVPCLEPSLQHPHAHPHPHPGPSTSTAPPPDMNVNVNVSVGNGKEYASSNSSSTTSPVSTSPPPAESPTSPPATPAASAAQGPRAVHSSEKPKLGRRKIVIRFIADKAKRQITFSKRKAGLMKKALELATLTGTQVLLLVASETGHVYTFATSKLQALVTHPEGKSLIQACLNAQDPEPPDNDIKREREVPSTSPSDTKSPKSASQASASTESANPTPPVSSGIPSPTSFPPMPQHHHAHHPSHPHPPPQQHPVTQQRSPPENSPAVAHPPPFPSPHTQTGLNLNIPQQQQQDMSLPPTSSQVGMQQVPRYMPPQQTAAPPQNNAPAPLSIPIPGHDGPISAHTSAHPSTPHTPHTPRPGSNPHSHVSTSPGMNGMNGEYRGQFGNPLDLNTTLGQAALTTFPSATPTTVTPRATWSGKVGSPPVSGHPGHAPPPPPPAGMQQSVSQAQQPLVGQEFSARLYYSGEGDKFGFEQGRGVGQA